MARLSFEIEGFLFTVYYAVTQALFTRPSFYDGLYPVLNVDGILSEKPDLRFWLNVQVFSLSLSLNVGPPVKIENPKALGGNSLIYLFEWFIIY